MKTAFILFFFLVIVATAKAQSPWYFGSGKAVNLTNIIEAKNCVQLIAGSLDPSSVAVNACAGSMYQATSGTIYVKQDAGSSTNWLPLGIATPGSLTTINGQSGPNVTIASGTAGTDFVVSAAANTVTLDIPSSSASNRGLLTSANWTTFNNKEPAITATTSADYYRGDKTFQPLDKAAVGLGNVDNTSDATKNAATVTLTNKTLTAPVINSPTGIVKGDVGLGNVDNTSDANKPISTATQTALDAKVTGVTSSVASEIALFDSTTGKLIKRATGTGFVKATSGVYSTAANIDLAADVSTTVLPMANGGTDKALTPVLGGVVYTDAGSMEVLAAGTSGQLLRSNGAAAPSWVTSSLSDKTCTYLFGGASATLAAPTVLTTGTGVEVHDSCGTGSPPTFNATGSYINLTWSSGTWANSTPLKCSCRAYGATTGIIPVCSTYWETGDQSWATNASGGYVTNFYTNQPLASSNPAVNTYIIMTCTGLAP